VYPPLLIANAMGEPDKIGHVQLIGM